MKKLLALTVVLSMLLVACSGYQGVSVAEDIVLTQYYPVLRAIREDVEAASETRFHSLLAGGIGNARDGMVGALEERGVLTAQEDQPAGGDVDPSALVPANSADLLPYLREGSYKDFVHESEVHTSRGPHADVLTYLNPVLEQSLAAGNSQHPVNSAAVKEIYRNGEHIGWAVSVKTQPDSANGEGWYWYEILSTTNPNAVVADSPDGHGLCIGCHFSGVDFILIDFPLR